MLRVLVGLLIAGTTLWLFDRVLSWAEARGWIYYRRNKPRGHASTYHLLEMSSIFSPSIQEVIEVRAEERREENEAGEPLRGVLDEAVPSRPHGES